MASTCRTGFTVPSTGIYLVTHSAHRLSKKVFLVKDSVFPRCAKCKEAVLFELAVSTESRVERPVHVQELPVIDDE